MGGYSMLCCLIWGCPWSPDVICTNRLVSCLNLPYFNAVRDIYYPPHYIFDLMIRRFHCKKIVLQMCKQVRLFSEYFSNYLNFKYIIYIYH